MKWLIAIMIASASLPALAQPPVVITGDERPSALVRYADLNLAMSSDQRKLHNRVNHAVRTVCRESLGPSAIIISQQRCRQFAWQGALPQMKRAVQRARELAATGQSSVAAASISITLP